MNSFFFGFLFIFFIIIVFVIQSIFHTQKYEYLTNYYTNFYLKHFHREPDPIITNYFSKIDSIIISSELNLYLNQVRFGRQFLKSRSILLTGLIRNAEKNIPFLQTFYQEFKSHCKEIRFLIVENDSHDATRKLLLEWANNDPNVMILCDAKDKINKDSCRIIGHEHFFQDKLPYVVRIKKLAYLRNLYLDFIKTNASLSNFDYLCVLDLDLNGNFFMDGIFHSFNYLDMDKKVSAISCNGMVKKGTNQYTYYDSFAYIEFGESYEWNTDFDKRSHDEEVLLYITRKYTDNMNLDHVFSAFGGFCIYDLKKVIQSGARYDYSKNNKLSCEHTHFHKHLKSMYVNPKMIFLFNEV